MDYYILISIYGEPPLLLLAPFGLLPTSSPESSATTKPLTPPHRTAPLLPQLTQVASPELSLLPDTSDMLFVPLPLSCQTKIEHSPDPAIHSLSAPLTPNVHTKDSDPIPTGCSPNGLSEDLNECNEPTPENRPPHHKQRNDNDFERDAHAEDGEGCRSRHSRGGNPS